VHPLICVGGRIIVQAEEFLDGGDGFGAGHELFACVPLSYSMGLASVGVGCATLPTGLRHPGE
jgi:hypothetical protein